MKDPTDNLLRETQKGYIDLSRVPRTNAAKDLAISVVRTAIKHRKGRPIGAKGLLAWEADLGAVLAGILRPGLDGKPVRCQRNPNGHRWLGASIGCRRVWGLLNCLKDAGLIGVRIGVKTPDQWEATGGSYGGLPTALWPSDALEELCQDLGCTAATRKADWAANPSQSANIPTMARAGLITVKNPVRTIEGPERAALERQLEALNGALAGAGIKGAGPTIALTRIFHHSLDFYGRFTAVGGGYQTLSQEERLAITFQGQPCAELDIKASQLTVMLGISKTSSIGDDPYSIPGLDRDVVKTWIVHSIGRGSIWWERWARGTKPDVLKTSAFSIREAALPHYPFLKDLIALVPLGVIFALPAELTNTVKKRCRLTGQWIVAQEAKMLATALDLCLLAGVPALPVHDSLIVPRSGIAKALEAIETAFQEGFGIIPRLEVR